MRVNRSIRKVTSITLLVKLCECIEFIGVILSTIILIVFLCFSSSFRYYIFNMSSGFGHFDLVFEPSFKVRDFIDFLTSLDGKLKGTLFTLVKFKVLNLSLLL